MNRIAFETQEVVYEESTTTIACLVTPVGEIGEGVTDISKDGEGHLDVKSNLDDLDAFLSECFKG